jgi:hypothetical protein
LIFWKPDSSARHENAEHHRDCVRPKIGHEKGSELDAI